MLINFVDATNDANHYIKPPPREEKNLNVVCFVGVFYVFCCFGVINDNNNNASEALYYRNVKCQM